MLPKLQSIIEFLSLNLSDLYNKISLCNINDSSVAKYSIQKVDCIRKRKWICYIYAATRNKIQPSQSNWNFADFPPVPLAKPELLKLTIICITVLDEEMPISTLIEESNISHAYRGSIVTFLGCRYNSRDHDRGTQRQFSEKICSEDHLRSRIFGTFVVKYLAWLPLLGFSNI